MAVQVGRANAVVLATDAATTTIDVNVGFTPVAGQYFVLVYWSGRTEAVDAVGAANLRSGIGMAVSGTSRCGHGGYSGTGIADSVTSESMYDDAIIKTLSAADAVDGALDFVGEVANGVRFIVDDQFPVDIRFQVVVITCPGGAAIFNIVEPGIVGNYDHTGAGPAINGDLFFFLTYGALSVPVIATQWRQMFGAATSDQNQWVVGRVSRDAQTAADTYYYATDRECAGSIGVTGGLNSRAMFVKSIPGGVRLNWAESIVSQIHFCGVLAGVDAIAVNGLTLTDTTTDIVTTGLKSTCLGGIVVSPCEAESTPDTGTASHHWSFGSFTATNNRGAHATWDEDATVTIECASAVEYDEVYANISSADVIQGLMDIKSLDAGGATFIMDDADPAGKWFGAVLIADAQSEVTPTTFSQFPKPLLRSPITMGRLT